MSTSYRIENATGYAAQAGAVDNTAAPLHCLCDDDSPGQALAQWSASGLVRLDVVTKLMGWLLGQLT
jgi:hypothetical protein